MAVLIQWAKDDGPIHLHSVWTNPVRETLELIEMIVNDSDGIVGFNLTFDFFHICKLYNVLSMCSDYESDPDYLECAKNEPAARDGVCLKPTSALDLFLYAKKGPYQSLMDRDDVRIKRVPKAIAAGLAEQLETLVEIKDIYFARRKDKYAPKWKVYDIEDTADFQDVVLKFQPSSALKALCVDALNLDPNDVCLFDDVSVSDNAYPEEVGWAPYALAIAPRALTTGDWKGSWPEKIETHVIHWAHNHLARKYAEKDVWLTRELYKAWGSPAVGDDDSILACSCAAIRWRGYKIDIPKINNLKAKALIAAGEVPTAPEAVRKWVFSCISAEEWAVLEVDDSSTDKVTLAAIEDFDLEKCKTCVEGRIKESEDDKGKLCHVCDGRGKVHSNTYEAGRRAGLVLSARKAASEVVLYDKLLQAGRFHASFKIIGALSGRMSGADGLNAQGIKATDEVRSCFTLKWPGMVLTGGDFSGFEVVIADAVYADPDLHRDLTVPVTCGICKGLAIVDGKPCKTCKGKGKYVKKLHGLFGQEVFTDMSYDEIVGTAGSADDRYSKAKRAVFALLYGGMETTLAERLGVDLETAEAAYNAFVTKYKRVGSERKKIFDAFCSMRQPNGIGSAVEWHEPEDYVESIFQFRRYFTLENKICKALFVLAENPPKAWTDIKIKVTRRDRVQTVGGATRSALFAAAFCIQAQNMRSAANHVIQSSGAQLTKKLQRQIWDLQPSGIGVWLLMPFQCHDEVQVPCLPEMVPLIVETQKRFVIENVDKVPLLEMDWRTKMTSWAGKH